MSPYFKNDLIWIVPAVLLLLTLFPLPLPPFYGLILQIVVSVAAAVIAYVLVTEKPNYYVIWAVTFVLIIFMFNPIIRLNIFVEAAVPLAFVVAAVFLTNWWFVFKKRK